jgi:hypothetical protein
VADLVARTRVLGYGLVAGADASDEPLFAAGLMLASIWSARARLAYPDFSPSHEVGASPIVLVTISARRFRVAFNLTSGVAIESGTKTTMNMRRAKSPTAPANRSSKRWTPNIARPELMGSQNAQKNYERYLAEHYFRSMSADRETT